MKLNKETGVYHFSTDSGFTLNLVVESAMDFAVAQLEKEIAELKKQRDEIVKYARHGLKCMYGFQGDKWKCTCGLEKLLPEPPKEQE